MLDAPWRGYETALTISNKLPWGGSDGYENTHVRLCKSTIIRPRHERGIGIINPQMQSKALLSKLNIRGFFLGNEPWKQLLCLVLDLVALQHGTRDEHSWRPNLSFLYSDAALSFSHVSPFVRSFLLMWSSMRSVLMREHPRCLKDI